MDRYDIEFAGEVTPDPESEEDQVLFKAGLQHEQAVLEQFERDGADISAEPGLHPIKLSARYFAWARKTTR